MEYILGIDTSNYKTSIAVVDREKHIICDLRRFLTVKQGERGLRQSNALFQHIQNLPELMEEMRSEFDGKISAIACSFRPRPEAGSYMPVFLAGSGFAKSAAAAMNVPLAGFSHQEGHMEAIRAYSPFQTAGRFLACHFSGGTCEVLDVSETDLRKDGMPKLDFAEVPAEDNAKTSSAKENASKNNGAPAEGRMSGDNDTPVKNSRKVKKPHPADPAERVAYTMHITGGTKDVSFGQVLDRTGVALGMGFPAGGQLDRMAQKFCEAEKADDPGAIFAGADRDMLRKAKEACRLTPVKVQDGWLNLSGLDTQARTRIDRLGLVQDDKTTDPGGSFKEAGNSARGQENGSQAWEHDLEKELQTCALAAELFTKTGRAASDMVVQCAEHSGQNHVLLAGGVASSRFLRSYMTEKLNSRGITAVFGDEMLSQDNAVGTALLGGKYLWG